MKARESLARSRFVGGLGAILAGAGLMYFADPQSGRRRRARLSDRLAHTYHEVDVTAGKAQRDLAHRTQGLVARLRRLFESDQANDRVIQDRVRTALGRSCSHPGAIEVEARDGRVVLRGPILEGELRPTLDRVTRVRGVREVDGELAPYDDPSRVPALQGAGKLPSRRREGWPPAWRLGGAAAGLGLIGAGLARRGVPGALLGAGGTGLLARVVANKPFRRIAGVGAGPYATELVKTLTIDAPVSEVYAFWRDLENFPRFMRHVEQVKSLGDGRYHWVVRGPAGATFSWNAQIEDEVPQHRLGWRSVEGAMIENAGRVRFESLPDGRTRLQLRLSYTPPAGAVGDALAHLLGREPKRALDEDLMRFKSLIERGGPAAATPPVEANP